MLTEKEVKRIKTYGLLIHIARPSAFMWIVPTGIWFVLIGIDQFVFETETSLYNPGFWVYLGFTIFYLFLFCYCTIRTRFGMLSKSFRAMVSREAKMSSRIDFDTNVAGSMAAMALGRQMKKSSNKAVSRAGAAKQAAGVAGTISAGVGAVGSIKEQLYQIAERCQVVLPSYKKVTTFLILLPFVAMTLVYLPEFQQSSAQQQADIASLVATETAIQQAFEPYFDRVEVEQPERSTYEYEVIGYLEGDEALYMEVSMEPNGTIKELTFCSKVMLDQTKEESIARFNTDIQQMLDTFQQADLQQDLPDLTPYEQIPQELVSEYLNDPQDQDSYVREETAQVEMSFSYQKASENATVSQAYYRYRIKPK